MNKTEIENIIRKTDYSLEEVQVARLTDQICTEIENGSIDFGRVNRNIFTQQKKKRVIYSYDKLSPENIACQYLKRRIDTVFKIKYASRNKIINILFNVLPTVQDLNDFVIVRADFKSFFDSVYSQHIYDKYIKSSMMRRFDKEMLQRYVKEFQYCYAGLCLSNGLTEIACRDFDERVKAKLSEYGIFYYERYVDDIMIIMNKYVSEHQFKKLVDECIKDVFGGCPVKLNTDHGKFSYITRRNIQSNQVFNFLGYEFEIKYHLNQPKRKFEFRYGITERKRNKYQGIIERAFVEYKNYGNIELFRQRLKLFTARIVIAKTIGSSGYDWLTKGVVANYNELRFHKSQLAPSTDTFLKYLYKKLFQEYNIQEPYFIKQSYDAPSIYNLYSCMFRNRTIVLRRE